MCDTLTQMYETTKKIDCKCFGCKKIFKSFLCIIDGQPGANMYCDKCEEKKVKK